LKKQQRRDRMRIKILALGLICFLLISCVQKSEKTQIAMKVISAISTALADFITDNGTAPVQDGIYSKGDSFYYSLSPFYLKEFPVRDPWGRSYRVYCGKACDGNYGVSGTTEGWDFVVVSYGRDGVREAWEFDPSDPEGGIFVIKDASDFDKDIVMWNGSWIRAPRGSIRIN